MPLIFLGVVILVVTFIVIPLTVLVFTNPLAFGVG